MKKGGKRFLVVPPGLAYGSQGMGSRVPANSTLLFEVEVVRVSFEWKKKTPDIDKLFIKSFKGWFVVV